MNQHPDTTVVTFVGGKALPQGVSLQQIARDYQSLLNRLYKNHPYVHVPVGVLQQRFKVESELLVFVLEGKNVVATAQGTLSRVEPDWRVIIGNVVVSEHAEGRGFGRRVMEALCAEALNRWGTQRPLMFMLTNNPDKENAGFYEKLGFSESTTRVWAKVMTHT